MPSQTYSFLTTQGTIAGPGGVVSIGSTSGAADEGITITPARRNAMTTGAGGDVMHSLHAQKSGTVSLRLLKTSPTNEQLSLMQALQNNNPSQHGINVMSFTDSARGDVIECNFVAFVGPPTNTYGRDGGTMTWEFDCGTVDIMLGS